MVVHRVVLVVCIALLGAGCSIVDSGSSKVQELEAEVAGLRDQLEEAGLVEPTVTDSGSSKVQELEAEVAGLRDQLEEAGLVEPTVTLGADPPPSSELIGFRSGNNIFVMDPYGRNVRQLTHHGSWMSEAEPYIAVHSVPQWSPDGTRIVYVLTDPSTRIHQHRLYVIGTDGTGGRELFDGYEGGFGRDAPVCGLASQPRWSPDGEWVLFECGKNIYAVSADGTTLRQLTHEGYESEFTSRGPAWSPDGRFISFRRTFVPWGPGNHSESSSEWIVIASFPDGEVVGILGPFHYTFTLSPLPFALWNPGRGDSNYQSIAFLSFGDGEGDGEDAEIFSAALDRYDSPELVFRSPYRVQHTDNESGEGSPVWAPVTSEFAFVGWTEDGTEIFVSDDGMTPNVRQLTNNLVGDGSVWSPPVWSPDAKQIAHSSDRDGSNGIYVMDAADGKNILSTGQSGSPWGWISIG